MRFAIIIPTYYRPDGKTKHYLIRALKSVNSQTHQDYRIYVIGDMYEKKQELIDILSLFDSDIELINLPNAIEREKYLFEDYRLFCAGGVNAVNTGIDTALKDGYEYICHLDHDDWWEENHLVLINEVIENKNPLFVCTLSTYYKSILPAYVECNEYIEYYPTPGCCCTSSACLKYSNIKLRFRDCFAETGQAYPADADLWQRMGDAGIKGYLIKRVTCHHDTEGYSLKGKFR